MLLEKIRQEAEGTNIQLLENESVEFGGFRFFGTTLWTDMALHGDPYVGSLEAMQMNDYKRIRKTPSYRKLRPVDARAMHHEALMAMRQFLCAGDPLRSVVITHHAPSMRSLPKPRRCEPISCAYSSHLDAFIEEYEPLLWVHGHIHHSQDYVIGKTRVLSNPRAYVDEPNALFESQLMVDLDAEVQRYGEVQ